MCTCISKIKFIYANNKIDIPLQKMSEQVFTINQQSFLDSSRQNLKIFDSNEEWVGREVLDTSPSQQKQQKSYIELLDQNHFSIEEQKNQKLAISVVQIIDRVHQTKSCFQSQFYQGSSGVTQNKTPKFPHKSKVIVYKSNVVRSLRTSLAHRILDSSMHVAKCFQINLKKQKIQVSLDNKNQRIRSISSKSGSTRKMKLSITDKSFVKYNNPYQNSENNPNLTNREQIKLQTQRQVSKSTIKQINLKPANFPQSSDKKQRKKIKLSLRK